MSNLYDVLETCLQELENGADLDTVLFRYPDLAEELRPILETAVLAKNASPSGPAADIVRRNRSKVLQRAAQLREAKARTSRRSWTVPLRRVLVALTVVGVLFVSSTGLVRAASNTLPGDNLYPVKRTWEDVRTWFAFDPQTRTALEVEQENERLDELKELFAEGRSVQVDFSGTVTRQNGDLWLIAGFPVAISPQTILPAQPIATGDAVHVLGTTQQDGVILAQIIERLAAGIPLPQIQQESTFEPEDSGDSNQAGENRSSSGSENEGSRAAPLQTPKPESSSGPGSEPTAESEPQDQSLNGVVESINGNILVVDGQILNVSSAEIQGTPRVGATVKVEGYYDANGIFIVTKIEIESSGSDSVSGSNDNGGSDSGSDSGTNDSGSTTDHGGSDGGSSNDSSGGGGED